MPETQVIIPVQRIDRPLESVKKWLRERFPKAGIRGVGIGYRRRGKTGKLTGQPVIKVILKSKKKRVSKSEMLPRWVTLQAIFLGKRIRVRLPIDIEESPRAMATRYEIDIGGSEVLTASAYARWGQGKFGVITAGHGLWVEPGGDELKSHVQVLTEQSCGATVSGKVIAASHLKKDGVDVGLVQVAGSAFDQCLRKIWAKVDLLSNDHLQDLLSPSPDDEEFVSSRFKHPTISARDLRSVSFFEEVEIAIQGWGTVTLKNIVETQADSEVFMPGTSGGGLVTSPGKKLALGIHAICLDPLAGGWSRSYGTSFATGVEWLRDRVGSDLDLMWKPPET